MLCREHSERQKNPQSLRNPYIRDLLGKGGFFEKKNAGDPNPATIHRDLPIETDEVKPNQETSTEGSTSDDDIESIFSSNTLSTVPSSANPVYTSGIKEVAQALLSQVELKNLYSTAILNLKLRKSRAHIRGCWKEYSRKLAAEVSNELEQKACKFVEELTGRLADEIRGYIAGFEEVNRPAPTESNKKDLEGWLSNIDSAYGHGPSKDGPFPSTSRELDQSLTKVGR